jgi:hypothetical protein
LRLERHGVTTRTPDRTELLVAEDQRSLGSPLDGTADLMVMKA